MAFQGLIGAVFFADAEADLHAGIAILFGGLYLRDRQRPRRDYRCRRNDPLLIEDLGHFPLFAEHEFHSCLQFENEKPALERAEKPFSSGPRLPSAKRLGT